MIIYVCTTDLLITACFISCSIVSIMVMIKVISLVLLFIIRIRFPADKSIADIFDILRYRYGNTLVKEVRKFEKIDYKLRKCKLGIVVLETYLGNKTIPKFLNFRVSNLKKITPLWFMSNETAKRRDICVKKSKVKTFEKDFIVLKRRLRETVSIIDYTHICCLVLNKYDRNFKINKISNLKSFLV